MKTDRAAGQHRVGSWDFLPDSGELRRHSAVRRLEPRAAKTLALLCQADGGIVTHQQLIAQVWSGRTLSDNSVSVVIGQLRRALDDDAREPRLIQTIPKCGYRLLESAAAATSRQMARPSLVVMLAIAAAVLLSAWALTTRVAPIQINVSDVSNETGDGRYDPLARATSELIVTGLSRRGFAVRRGVDGNGLKFRSKMVMWNRAPSLGMTVTDARGIVLWSAMTNGSADRVPAGVAAELDRFVRLVDPKKELPAPIRPD